MGLLGGLKNLFLGMGSFETKIEELVYKESYFYGVYCRGSIPIQTASNLAIVTSVVDVTDRNNLLPIMYIDSKYQEEGSNFYRDVKNLGLFKPGYGYADWTPISLLSEDHIFPPFKGLRILAIHTRIINTDLTDNLNLTKFNENYMDGRTTKYINFQFLGKHGYIEFDDVIEQLELLSVKIAMYIAMVDGSLHKSEGDKIKGWAKEKLETIDPIKVPDMKKKFNATIKKTNTELARGLNINAFKKYLSEFEEHAGKYDKTDLFTLILDVMVSDGIAHEKQMELINLAKDIIDYDYETLKSIQDHKIINIENLDDKSSNIEEIIGITENMSLEEINQKLSQEFNKWNSRLESFSEEKERDNATKMLQLIANIREKYNEE